MLWFNKKITRIGEIAAKSTTQPTLRKNKEKGNQGLWLSQRKAKVKTHKKRNTKLDHFFKEKFCNISFGASCVSYKTTINMIKVLPVFGQTTSTSKAYALLNNKVRK